ncbi:dienelactone hydrolase family protein [Paracoccus sp. SCSIO 75233]|uniref:dienelactone hydrolase family protein n=1 Tax=Paracoccus sp. SCSIO 75233 TaxID=3017782 RepID=UPI0022F11F61|nr:dienelactone hydrolase family protein [Paracoccus sp. SCSIO 75233]WBU54307.1 dienelactone hydrolase family protein [Paracoccus sp. SCSIO 75233]
MRVRWWWVVLGLIVLVVAGLGANTLRHLYGVAALTDTPEARRADLAEYWRMIPDGPVSGAGSIMLSGCDGVRDNMEYWGGVMAERGHDALILDSHQPRGLDQLESWRLLCVGQVLPGAQRAGDLAVAMAETEQDNVVLLGASHGGWTVLEFLRRELTRDVPPGLTEWPSPPGEMLKRVGAAVVLYPYCGVLNGAVAGDWSDMPPVLMIIAGQDELNLAADCLKMAEDLRARGAMIDTVYYADAGHGFEQQERAPLSLLEFRPDLRDAATQAVEAFLDRNGL